jgi:hypothetical protein
MIPAFLCLTLGVWLLLLVAFVTFSLWLRRQPDDRILKSEAKAIENKRRLGIKVYKF